MRSTILLFSAAFAACGGARNIQTDRQAEVAARGAQVMPFDLDKTLHVFAKDSSGGVQTVTAKDPEDTLNVRLVREHLQLESRRFARGEFSDPATIHGDAMPGLAELRAGAGRVTADYADLPAGGQIRYVTTDRVLRSALHRWFDAQVMDHGKHARHQ